VFAACLCLLLRRCSAKLVEADVEPLVDLAVQRVVLVADLAGGESLLHGLGLGRRAVLVRAAHVQHVVATQPGKPDKSQVILNDRYPTGMLSCIRGNT
jgi:hypothetical protein